MVRQKLTYWLCSILFLFGTNWICQANSLITKKTNIKYICLKNTNLVEKENPEIRIRLSSANPNHCIPSASKTFYPVTSSQLNPFPIHSHKLPENIKLTHPCDTTTWENIKLGFDSITYPGLQVTLLTSHAIKYQWTPTTGLSCGNCQFPVATIADSITYTVTLTDSFGCLSREKFILPVRNCDTIQKNVTLLKLKDTITGPIQFTLQPDTSFSGYYWPDTAGLTFDGSRQYPVASVDTNTNYIVLISDQWRCPYSELFEFLKLSSTIHIPNVITPNNPLNEFLTISGSYTGSLFIYDVKGYEVYHIAQYDNHWNGKDSNGNSLNEGTYYYIYDAPNGEIFKGWVYIKK